MLQKNIKNETGHSVQLSYSIYETQTSEIPSSLATVELGIFEESQEPEKAKKVDQRFCQYLPYP